MEQLADLLTAQMAATVDSVVEVHQVLSAEHLAQVAAVAIRVEAPVRELVHMAVAVAVEVITRHLQRSYRQAPQIQGQVMSLSLHSDLQS
jgi:hypothetical protein